MASNSASGGTPHFDIPKECKAGVVVNEGPDFHVEVQMVPVPEPGISLPSHSYQYPVQLTQPLEYLN